MTAGTLTPKARSRDWLFGGLIAALAVILLPKLWLSDTPLYTRLLTPTCLIVVTGASKLLFLVAAAVAASGVARAFGRRNPAGAGWTFLAVGLGAYAVAQAILVWYQSVLRVPSPYPSLADPLFVLGMLLLVWALWSLLHAYTRGEWPLASDGEVARLAAIVALPILALGAWLLRPVFEHPAPVIEELLNITYPILDCALLVPTFILARITSRLRGGEMHRVWTLLLAGCLCTAVGDVAFSYVSTLGMKQLDPLVHLLFCASYALWAWGAALQRDVARAPRETLPAG